MTGIVLRRGMQTLDKSKLRSLKGLKGESKQIQEDTDANSGMSIKPERKSMHRGSRSADSRVKIGAKGNGKRWREGRRGSPVHLFNSPQPLPIYQGK